MLRIFSYLPTYISILTSTHTFTLIYIVIYKALIFDVAQGRMNGAPNEIRTHSCRCYVLTFWPGQKCHSRWRTGRKWYILMAVMRGNRVGGNWLMKSDEVKKKVPLYSHRLTHRKRVTSELNDSYFRSMTITQAIPKIAEVAHPDRQISEEIAEAWRRVHITAWKCEGNIRPTNWTEDSWVEFQPVGGGERWDVVGKATPGRRGPREPWLNWGPEKKDTTLTTITVGSKYFSYFRSLTPSHMQTLSNPFRTLAIKWEVNIFIKKSSCVCLCLCVFIIVSLWYGTWEYNIGLLV